MRERETIREHKNYLPALILTMVFFGLLGALIFFVDPSVIADFPIRGSYFVFFLVVFFAVWFLMSLLMGNRRRGGLVAVGVIFLGYLRLWKMMSWINVLLLIVLLVGFEIYSRNSEKG